MALGSGSGVWTATEDDLATSGTQWLTYFGARVAAPIFTKGLHVVEGVFSQLRVELENAPGAGNTRTFELHEDAVATGLKVTISGTEKQAIDVLTRHTVGTINGSTAPVLEFKSTETGTSIASRVRLSMLFENTNHDYEHCFSGLTGDTKLSTTTQQITLAGDVSSPINGTTGAGLWLPNAGTIRAFGVRLNTQTASGKQPDATRRFELFKNGTVIAGGTINFFKNGGNGQVKVAFPDVTYADGDNLLVQSTIVLGSPADSYVSIGVGLSANEDEFATAFAGASNLPAGTVTNFAVPFGSAAPTYDSSAILRRSCGMEWRCKKLRTHVTQLPGGKGQSWVITWPFVAGLKTIYGPSSSADQTDETGTQIVNFENLAGEVAAVSIGSTIKSKLSASVLMGPQNTGGMSGCHF